MALPTTLNAVQLLREIDAKLGPRPTTLPSSINPVQLLREIVAKLDTAGGAIAFGAKGDGVTDDTAAFAAALVANDGVVFVFDTGSPYIVNALNLPSGSRLVGLGRPILKCTTGSVILYAPNRDDIEVSGFKLDGNKASVSNTGAIVRIQATTWFKFWDNDVVNAKTPMQFDGATNDCEVRENRFKDGADSGIFLTGSGVTGNRFIRNEFSANAGFGIDSYNGANRNLIEGNRTVSNTLELIGIRFDSWGNRIVGNHAEGTGDNGISVTGYQNLIDSNTCRRNFGTGICIFGRDNVCVGNLCEGNGSGGTFAGIQIIQAYGGTGQSNTIVGNSCDDDQSVKTQDYGIWIGSGAYTAWAQGQVITIGLYRRNAHKLYVSTTAGTTGATPPTHTSSTASDGAVTWQFVETFRDTADEPYANTVRNNRVSRSATASYKDDTSAHLNELSQDTFSTLVDFTNSLFGKIIMANGDPESNVSAPVGSYFFRLDTGSVYKKATGTGSTGWTSVNNHPGYLASLYYSTFAGLRTSAAISNANQLQLYPFWIPHKVAITALTARFTAAGVGSSMKTGIWANNLTIMRPSGAPLIVDNTGVSTAGTPGEITIPGTGTLTPGHYWAGTKFTGTLPTMVVVATTDQYSSWAFGFTVQAAFSTSIIKMTDTYSNNMPTLATNQAWTETSDNATLIGFKT